MTFSVVHIILKEIRPTLCSIASVYWSCQVFVCTGLLRSHHSIDQIEFLILTELFQYLASFSCQLNGRTFDSRILRYTEKLIVALSIESYPGQVTAKQGHIITPPPLYMTTDVRCRFWSLYIMAKYLHVGLICPKDIIWEVCVLFRCNFAKWSVLCYVLLIWGCMYLTLRPTIIEFKENVLLHMTLFNSTV